MLAFRRALQEEEEMMNRMRGRVPIQRSRGSSFSSSSSESSSNLSSSSGSSRRGTIVKINGKYVFLVEKYSDKNSENEDVFEEYLEEMDSRN